MNCPNCQLPIVEEKAEKIFCSTCGWFEKVDKEWQGCEAPEPEPVRTPEPEPKPKPEPEPDPAALEPDPAALEPDPAALGPDPAAQEPDPNRSVKKYLGGLITITEVDE